VTFDDLQSPQRPLTGQYPNGLIDWGANPWYLSGPWGRFSSNSVSFDSSGMTSATFTLLSPRRLTVLDAYNGGTTDSTVSLACPGQITRQISLASNELATVATNWTGVCSSITLSSSNGWYTNFDNLAFDTGFVGPTSTPTATPTPRTVTFDDLQDPLRPLNGQYPTGLIDWGTNAWFLAGPYAQFATNSVSFNGASLTSASFTLLTSNTLRRLDIDNGGTLASTVTISCPGQPTATFSLAPGQFGTFTTGWTTPCTTITITSSNGWDTNFDNLVVQ
jgi:hypothetical protein